MSGDSKIGPVGATGRAVPLRRVASDNVAAMRTPAQLQPAQENLPAAKLTRLAGSLADQAPPVDVARVAALRVNILKNWTRQRIDKSHEIRGTRPRGAALSY